jgi:hypothetical protein
LQPFACQSDGRVGSWISQDGHFDTRESRRRQGLTQYRFVYAGLCFDLFEAAEQFGGRRF